jgi:hypothetical protein
MIARKKMSGQTPDLFGPKIAKVCALKNCQALCNLNFFILEIEKQGKTLGPIQKLLFSIFWAYLLFLSIKVDECS